MHDLGTLGGAYSSAAAINNSGVIVGEAEAITNDVVQLHAFKYENGVMTDLGTLGRLNSSASAVNSAGHIVGYVANTDNDLNPFLFNGSTLVNLNDYLSPNSGWVGLVTADGINDAGQITGAGVLENGEYHAYLLTPSQSQYILLSSPSMLLNGQFQFSIQGLTGEQFVVQYSIDLSNWSSLATNTLSGTSTNFTDVSAPGNSPRFYRAVLLQP
jgi:probable HAF family extracellular repeat protein